LCLGIPALVLSIDEESAFVEVDTIKRKVVLLLDEKVEIGDWVLLHSGFAISKLSSEDAEIINKAFKGEV
jgi:hydrogenase expression/formation protein HypC